MTQETLPANSKLINTFSNVAGYKIKSNKSVVVLYTNEKVIKETSPFTIATNSIKYLGVTLTKEVKTYLTRTLKLRRKKLKKTPENEKISHVLG